MGLLLLWLEVFLSISAASASHEALVIIGGTIGWPDGAEISEVEVWSPSPECGINIKDPPVTFPDYPAVAYFGENLYVCGGQSPEPPYNQDNLTMMNRCYMYSMRDNEWSEGPTLKFFYTPSSSGLDIELWLATVGKYLVAVFKQNSQSDIYMSTLVDNEWSVPIVIDPNPAMEIFSMLAIDKNHFALLQASLFFDKEFIEIINVETGSIDVRLPMASMCFHGFLYNGLFSCMRSVNEVPPYAHEIRSLSFQENFEDPTWSLAYYSYDLPGASYWYNKMAVLDGLLALARLEDATVNYQTGDQDQWRAAELDIPREHAMIAVVPCEL